MDIWTLWITRTYAQDTPELLEAWSEYDIDANHEGWQEAKQKALDSIGSDLHVYREIDIKVDYEDICKAFADAEVKGEVGRDV